MSLPETLYHTAARARRRWFAARPDARRTLARPVVSVGNLTFGGSGKTPIVASMARLLLERGERPAIISRGYGRRRADPGVVLVSDGQRILADLDRAGDEPLMLARALPGAIVCVAPERYLAGRLAELHCGATVHILDDGFQHVALSRDVDMLVIDGREEGGTPLREPLESSRLADAWLVAEGAAVKAVPSCPRFHWRRELRPPAEMPGHANGSAPAAYRDAGPALAVAAIAAPNRFFDDLKQSGADLRETVTFPDHHAFSGGDIARIGERARQAGCRVVVTTAKDAVRLRPFRPLPFEVLVAPLGIVWDPAENLSGWLAERLSEARAQRRAR